MANEILIPLSAVYLFFIIQSIGNSFLAFRSFRSALRFRKEEEYIMADSNLDEFEKYLNKTGENLVFSTIAFGLIMIFESTHINGFYLPKIASILFTFFILVGWILTIIHQFYLKKAIDSIMSQTKQSAEITR